MTAPAIQLANLSKTYPALGGQPPRTALDNLSLSIAHGERVALLGPNGSGKSTLLKLLSLSHAPTSGQLSALGTPLAPAPPESARRAYLAALGVVFQAPGLDALLTIRENLATQAALVGLSRAPAAARIAELGRALAIDDRLDQRVGTLSGGLARRADLARALLHHPRLLLLDEATTGLDPAARAAFMDVLAALPPTTTILYTTHLIDEAERASRVIMMAEGRIVADGPPLALRSALGGHLIRIAHSPDNQPAFAAASLALHNAGFVSALNDAHTFRPHATTPDALEHAAALLARSGLAFEIGPPNLADAYLAATGATLTTPAPHSPPVAPHRAKRGKASHAQR